MIMSPRGRGKPALRMDDDGFAKSIPAWAGETAAHWKFLLLPQVYPRVGGELDVRA